MSWADDRKYAEIRAQKAAVRQQQADALSLNAEANAYNAVTDRLKADAGIQVAQQTADTNQLTAMGDLAGAPSTGVSGISPGMQSTLDLAAQAGSQPMGADFAKNLGLDSYEPGVRRYADGGPIYGPPGLDQVPAEMPDGSPARLNDGEYVLPKEYVIGLAKKSLGKKGDMLAPEKLHALGVDLLDGEVAQYTGQQPGAKPAPPLPGQQEGMVPAMADGQGFRLSKYGQQGAQWVPPSPDPTLYNGRPLESTGGVPITRQGSEQARMLSEQGMNNTLALSPGAFRDARTIYTQTAAPVDTRRTGIPQVPSNVLPKSVERAQAAQRPIPPAPVTSDLATQPMRGAGDAVTPMAGNKGIYIQRFQPGTPEYAQYGAAIISNSARGATKSGFEQDLAQKGEGVGGARLIRGKMGNTPVGPELTQALALATQGGRNNQAAQLGLDQARALHQYMGQPQISGMKTATRDGRRVTSFDTKAPMPNWGADMLGMPRRGETPRQQQMRALVAQLPATRQAAAQQALVSDLIRARAQSTGVKIVPTYEDGVQTGGYPVGYYQDPLTGQFVWSEYGAQGGNMGNSGQVSIVDRGYAKK